MNSKTPEEIMSSTWKVCALYDEALLKEVRDECARRLFWRTIEAMFFNEQLAVIRGDDDQDYIDTKRSIEEALNEIDPKKGKVKHIAHAVIQLAIMTATIFESNEAQSKNSDGIVRSIFKGKCENPINCQQTICRILYLLNKKRMDQFVSESQNSSFSDRLIKLFKS